MVTAKSNSQAVVRVPDNDVLPPKAREQLRRFIPPGINRSHLRHSGTHWMCWRCGAPKTADQFPSDDDIICTKCVPVVLRWTTAIIDEVAPETIERSLSKLKKRAGPANAAGVERLLDRLDNKDTSVPELALDLYEEAQELPERNMGVEKELLKVMQRQIEKRDDSMFGKDKYEDIEVSEILANALEIVIDQMHADNAYLTTAITAMCQRVPTFLEGVLRESQATIIEEVAG